MPSIWEVFNFSRKIFKAARVVITRFQVGLWICVGLIEQTFSRMVFSSCLKSGSWRWFAVATLKKPAIMHSWGDASKTTIAICWGCVYNCNWQLLQGIWIHVSTIANHCWRSIIVSSNTIAKIAVAGFVDVSTTCNCWRHCHIYKYKIAIAAWEAGKHPGIHCSLASIGTV